MDVLNNIKPLFTEDELQKRIEELAKEIDKTYEDLTDDLIVISVLKGSIYFTCDLTRKMKTPIILDMIRTHSYIGMESTGNVQLNDDYLDSDLSDKNILIVEDIVDTGNTLYKLRNYVLAQNPKSLKIAVLLDKKEKRTIDVPIDFVGFDVPNKFIVGYGFDYDEKYRNIPYVGYVES